MSSARYTRPMPPRPSSRSMRYPAMVVPMRESVVLTPRPVKLYTARAGKGRPAWSLSSRAGAGRGRWGGPPHGGLVVDRIPADDDQSGVGPHHVFGLEPQVHIEGLARVPEHAPV